MFEENKDLKSQLYYAVSCQDVAALARFFTLFRIYPERAVQSKCDAVAPTRTIAVTWAHDRQYLAVAKALL